jgi:16S rRNA (cytosine967-C5)-methyltransferase
LTSTQLTSARFAAIETLRLLEKERIPVGVLFEKVLKEHPVQQNDRQLANNIIQGVLRNRQSLDCMLQNLCSQPLKKLKPFIHQTLRVGLFQIMYLDRIPDSAAVNESVNAVRAAKLPKQLHGFVNGVLRNAIRKRDELQKLVNNPNKPILNHPEWMINRWKNRYGNEKTLQICLHNSRQALLTLQVNSCQTTRDALLAMWSDLDIEARKCLHSETGIILSAFHGQIGKLPGFAEGLFQVQDQGAQLLSQLLLPIIPGGKYLDSCAGAGGKTSTLIQLCDATGATVTAVEPDAGRRRRFTENMKRLHPGLNVPVFEGKLQDFSKTHSSLFQGILLDAPCSGTGVTGRHPDIRWNRRQEDLQKYQQTQLNLLQCAATLLAPGGVLIYATCSLEEEENEQAIEIFLAKNSAFSLEPCESQLPESCANFFHNSFFAPLPQAEMDGFFGAKLRKSS